MDFPTSPMSRKEAIKLGEIFRTLFGYDEHSPFNPLEALERIHLVMPDVTYQIVEDNDLSQVVHAVCEMDENEKFTIKIKETIYCEAYENANGASLMDITHEMVHPFLYKMGYKPIMARCYGNLTIPAYISAEWQTKAVAGEVMIPYEASKDMTYQEIMDTYHVSLTAANYRRNIKIK